MSVFGGLILTNRGRNLQAKVQAGTQLKYTGVKLGDGSLGTSIIADLTTLKNTVLSLPISKLKVLTGGRATIGVILRNNDLTSGFYFRELGVFAQDPDLGEILYCYGNAGNLAEYIPAGGGADVIEKAIDIETFTGNASNVSAVLDSSLIFETVEGAQAKANAAETKANSYTDNKVDEHSADDLKHITQQPTIPEGIEEGRLWLDTSDNSYQGTLFDSFSSQLDNISTDLNEVNVKLAEIPKQRDFIRYGKLKLPSDFPITLPFNLYRNRSDGKIIHDFDFDALLNTSEATVYLNHRTGADANDGLTSATAVKRFDRAIAVANSLAAATVTIEFMQADFPYTEWNAVYAYTLQKNIILKPSAGIGKVVIHSGRGSSTFTWTAEGTAYKTARTAVSAVLDVSKSDYRGNTLEYKKVNSVAEVQAEKGTWYTDGTTVWIRRTDDSAIDNNIIMQLPLGNSLVITNTGKKLIMDKMEFLFDSSNGSALQVVGNNASYVYHRNCAFAYAEVNGLRTDKQAGTYAFQSRAYKNGSDGFNYHATKVETPYEFSFEYYIESYENGAVIASTGNATTAHEGMTMLRVGSLGYDCNGPILADVNGCYSYNIDCVMYDSLRPAGSTKAAYYFDETTAVKQGKAYLINCSGGGVDTYTLNTDGLVDIYVKNLIGHNIPESLVLNYVS